MAAGAPFLMLRSCKRQQAPAAHEVVTDNRIMPYVPAWDDPAAFTAEPFCAGRGYLELP